MGYAALASSIQWGSTWYTPEAGGHMTPAGYWYALVSLPIFHFLLYRWLYRMVVWTRFLRALSMVLATAALTAKNSRRHPGDSAGGDRDAAQRDTEGPAPAAGMRFCR
jgi:hypothetical protein